MAHRLPVAALAIIISATASGHAQTPAPFAPPPPGTRFVYTTISNTVTRRDGWRTYFTDDKGRAGAHIGGFIPDNPDSPLSFDSKALASLWPLRLRAAADVETRRDPLAWRWSLTVVDTATVTVPAGRFHTYVVQAIETPRIAASRNPRVNVTTFWYAPALGAVVRFRSGLFEAERAIYSFRQELVRVERPSASPRE
jgi:hypothetical protein